MFNCYPINVPYMAQLVMFTFELRNRSRGWSSGTVRVLLLVCLGFETDCNDFLFLRVCR